MPWLDCKICDKSFYAKPRHIKIGWGKYCSKKCQYIGQKSGKKVKCATCGMALYRTPRDFKKSKSKKFFCNKSCFCIWKNKHLFFGDRHVNWKGGERAYRAMMLRGGTKQICRLCKNDDKRILIVHHLDKNRKNNNIKNLIWLCRNCHHLVHSYGQKLK
ncbi:MAG: hypothetical protein AAB731_01360 [Patescibacteria group bacterium]